MNNTKHKYAKGRVADKALLALLLGGVCLFVLYPLACNLARSFAANGSAFTLDNYEYIWQKYARSLANSVVVGISTAILCTLLSLSVALFLSARRGFARALVAGVILVAMVSPPFVSSLSYIQLYGRRGLITYRLLGLRLDPYGPLGIILMQSLSFMPLNALFLGGLLKKLDCDSLKSARDLGAEEPDVLRGVVLAQLRPGILVCLLLTFIRSLADFGTPIIIGGRFSTLAAEIYLQIVGYSNIGRASAMSVILLLPAVASFFVYRGLMRRSELLNRAARTGGEAPAQQLSKCGVIGILATVLSVVCLAATVLQYACVFASGFLKSARGAYSFTLDNLVNLFTLDADMLVRSVVYAFIIGILGTLFAMLFAFNMDRRKIPLRGFFDCAATLPYMIPGICFGISYILAFNSPPLKLTGTAAIVLINMLFKQLPTTTKICSAALTRIPVELERSVGDLGGGRFAVLKDAIWPSMKGAFAECFSYNFSSSMTTAGAILFLINPARKLAVFKLFDAVYTGDYAMASLIATLIIAVVLLVEGAAFIISGRAARADVP